MPAPTKDVGASFYNKITPEPNTGCHIMADKKRKGRVSRTRIFGTANHAWRHGRYAVARGGA